MMPMSVTAFVVAALEGDGIRVAKGVVTAIGSGAGKFVWGKFFGGKAKAAEGVVAMAVIHAIEESTPGANRRDMAWWTRAGQRLIKPFIDKHVAGFVVNTMITQPEDGEAIPGTLIAALDNTGHSLDELARELDLDAERFLHAIPAILLEELLTAAAEPGSTLLPQATLATLRQIAERLGINPASGGHRPGN
jgi:hypothetical protein